MLWMVRRVDKVLTSLVIFCALLVTDSASAAESAKDAAEEYQVVKAKADVCKQTLKIGYLRAKLGQTTGEEAYKAFLDCQFPVMARAKAVYAKVLPKIRSTPGKNALKDYHASLMMVIESDQRDSESDRAYEARHGAMVERMQTHWQRLQLEL